MARVGQSCVGIPELVKEGVYHGINGRQSLRRSVLQKLGDQIDRSGVSLPKDLVEWMRLDLGEFVLHVVGIHGSDLITSGSTQDLDDLYKLINARFSWKQWLSKHQFRHDTASRPDINFRCVVGSAKYEFRRTVVSRADVRNIRLVLYQNLGATEIAKLEDAAGGVEEEVLRLDISVADALRVYVCERAEQLVDVELDLEDRHGGFHLVEVAGCAVNSLGDKLENEVEIDFILAFAIGIVESLELDNVGVSHYPHDLQFSVLEALVLQHSLDGSVLPAGRQLGLEDDTERAIADDFALSILHLFRFTSQAILDLFANNLTHP